MPPYDACVSGPLQSRLMGYVRVAMGLIMIPMAYIVGRWSEQHGSSGPLAAASITGVLSILIFFWLRESESKPSQPIATKRASFKEQWQLIRQNRELGIFLVTTTICGFGNILTQPLYQIIQKSVLELSFIEIGIARTTYFTCLLCSYFIVGSFIDKLASRQIVLSGIAAYSTVPMLYGLSESFPIVIIGSGVQGFGDAIWDIGILAYVCRLAPGREAIGPLLSTGLTDVLPFSSMLLTASICGWIGSAIFMLANRKASLR
jgi:Na+/melibiose symporter-like transporter